MVSGAGGGAVPPSTLMRRLLSASLEPRNPLVAASQSSNSPGARQPAPEAIAGRLPSAMTSARQGAGAADLVQAAASAATPKPVQGTNSRLVAEHLLTRIGAGWAPQGPKIKPNHQVPTTQAGASSVVDPAAKTVGSGSAPRHTSAGQMQGQLMSTELAPQQRAYAPDQNKSTAQSQSKAWQLIIEKPDRGIANLGPAKQGGRMLSPEGVNMMPRPNTVYVEGAAAGVRVEPEQARTLGLRAGETINAVVTQRQDGNVLLIGKQQLPLPDRMNLPAGQVSLLVRVVAGQTVLALTDPALAAQVAAGAKRTDADARFARLLNHVGSFHLARALSPGFLTALTEQSGSPQMQRSLAALLLDSRQLSAGNIRTAVESAGLFGEHQASLNAQQGAPGLKSMLISLRALMQARQMETTSLSGAIDEIEARQLDSLAQQATGRTHYSWVLPFADQYPVYIELEHQKVAGSEEGNAQSVWSVDLEVGLTASVAMAANVRVDQDGGLGLRLWLPDPNFYRLAQASRGQLEEMIAGQGLSLIGLTVYPVARDAGTVDDSRPRMGVSIDA